MLSKNQIKYIQSLGQKKCRDEEDAFIAEGPKIVNELLNAKNCIIRHIYALKDWMDKNEHSNNQSISEIAQNELEKISQLKTPNQVLLIAEKKKWGSESKIKGAVSLVLDNIQDPGNMGTIIRLADWFGINQITCSQDCVDLYNPKVVQASMGSIARVRVDYSELEIFLQNNKDVNSYATALKGNDVTQMKKISEGIIIIGNESKGISEKILNEVDNLITIPGKGKAESLNAAVATGIILSHLIQ